MRNANRDAVFALRRGRRERVLSRNKRLREPVPYAPFTAGSAAQNKGTPVHKPLFLSTEAGFAQSKSPVRVNCTDTISSSHKAFFSKIRPIKSETAFCISSAVFSVHTAPRIPYKRLSCIKRLYPFVPARVNKREFVYQNHNPSS